MIATLEPLETHDIVAQNFRERLDTIASMYSPQGINMARRQLVALAMMIAEDLKNADPNFKFTKFLMDCGVE